MSRFLRQALNVAVFVAGAALIAFVLGIELDFWDTFMLGVGMCMILDGVRSYIRNDSRGPR